MGLLERVIGTSALGGHQKHYLRITLYSDLCFVDFGLFDICF